MLRYLAAFGPASPADMRAWSGLAMRPAFERCAHSSVSLRDEHDVELFDLPKSPRPAPNSAVPVRLLPDYDNILLAHADRTRIMAPGQHLGLFSSNGIMKGSVLVDGFVRAGWKPIRDKSGTALVITPFDEPFRRQDRSPVTAEALRLLAFLAPGREAQRRVRRCERRGYATAGAGCFRCAAASWISAGAAASAATAASTTFGFHCDPAPRLSSLIAESQLLAPR